MQVHCKEQYLSFTSGKEKLRNNLPVKFVRITKMTEKVNCSQMFVQSIFIEKSFYKNNKLLIQFVEK